MSFWSDKYPQYVRGSNNAKQKIYDLGTFSVWLPNRRPGFQDEIIDGVIQLYEYPGGGEYRYRADVMLNRKIVKSLAAPTRDSALSAARDELIALNKGSHT